MLPVEEGTRTTRSDKNRCVCCLDGLMNTIFSRTDSQR